MRFAVILLLAFGGTASSQPKPKIAILGLEVVSSAVPSKDDVRVAQELTLTLRTQPKAGRGPYVIAPGCASEGIDPK